MTRDLFVRLVTIALNRCNRNDPPEVLAERIADDVERSLLLIRELRSGVFSKEVKPDPGWTESGPESIGRWPEPAPQSVIRTDKVNPSSDPSAQGSPSITDHLEDASARVPPRRSAPAPPSQALKHQSSDGDKPTVEELNLLVQSHTPASIEVDVEYKGKTYKVQMLRDVISAHAEGCVKILYYHPKAKNDLYVTDAISIEDYPVDMDAIVAKLRRDAELVLKPRDGSIVSVRPAMPDGPVTHQSESQSFNDQVTAILQTWNSIG